MLLRSPTHPPPPPPPLSLADRSFVVTVGTQAAVLAGLDITMFIEFQPPPTEAWGHGHLAMLARILKFLYYIMIVSAFCSNMMVVAHTTALSVLGAGMALRGPDGSMMTATDGLYEERKTVFSVFGIGLACTVGSVVLCVWLILHWEAALVCMSVTVYTCCKIYRNYQRVLNRFDFDESQTVDFHDIFNGPAAIRVMSHAQPAFGKMMNGSAAQASKRYMPKRTKSSDEQDEEEEGLAMLTSAWEQEETMTIATNGTSNSSPTMLRRQSSSVVLQQHQQQPYAGTSIQTV